MNVIADQIQTIIEKATPLPQVELPTRHFLCDGMYLRQVLIREGTLFVGRVHKKEHYFMVVKGSAGVTMDDGSVFVMRTGTVLMSPPGTRRAGVTYEDTVFVTVHRTAATDLKEIEDDVVEFDPKIHYGLGNVHWDKLLENQV